ncbi:MAG: peptide-methionine (S)-S-oxide reductase MsrA [Pseudomonadota bacterium]
MRFVSIFAAVCLVFAGSAAAEERRAVFAGGCFWCVEADFDKLDGVLATVSGFAGGSVEDPSYRQVVAGGTGHLEVVEVRYNADVVSFRELADYHLRHIDPTDAGGQFCDRGESYTTALFYETDAERTEAEAALREAEDALGEPLATPVRRLDAFYPAEEYHQDYYLKKPNAYRFYRASCGRDRRVKRVWSAVAE